MFRIYPITPDEESDGVPVASAGAVATGISVAVDAGAVVGDGVCTGLGDDDGLAEG